MRVLLIEDEKPFAHITSKMLRESAFIVEIAELGEDGYNLGKNYQFDIILLDLDLPDISGFEVLRKLRESNVDTPVLILSGNIEVDDKIIGLNQGADDYVTKPFDRKELIARMHAIIRRSFGLSNKVIEVKDLKLDISGKTVYRGSEVVYLTGKEFQLMELLTLRRGTIISKEMIWSHLYDETREAEIKSIDVLVYNLRKKLDPDGDSQKYIETIWGRGYLVQEPDEIPESNKT